MGSTVIGVCSCRCAEPERKSEEIDYFVAHTFKDKRVKIVDFTGIYKKVNSIEEVMEIMPKFLPYEIKSFRRGESEHSFVSILGLYVKNQKIQRILMEIFYNAGHFVIYLRSRYGEDEPSIGTIEFVYTFSEDAIYTKNFHDFLIWLQTAKLNPKLMLTEEQNMGKLIYSQFKNMGSKRSTSL